MNKLSVEDLDLAGKRVLMRVALAISCSETPRISRSRFRVSPKVLLAIAGRSLRPGLCWPGKRAALAI